MSKPSSTNKIFKLLRVAKLSFDANGLGALANHSVLKLTIHFAICVTFISVCDLCKYVRLRNDVFSVIISQYSREVSS